MNKLQTAISNQKKFINSEIDYSNVIKKDIQFGVALKTLPTKGNLVYEYNPFRNYRLTQTRYSYKNKLLTCKELLLELKIESFILNDNKQIETINATEDQCLEYLKTIKEWKTLVPENETDPVLLEPGELTDFETNELSFDINHPVDIIPQYSYDNSVNLIINDGKNIPRLINSRFSATSKNKYQIVDRKGNNDTNIYDQGSQFDIDTSLYKRVVEIPKLRFIGVYNGGSMPVGNYHFYFKYADADGNETDYIAESGLVSVFIGNEPTSIKTGFRDENSHKIVQFSLSNIDSAYQYVTVYYTKSTSDIFQNKTTKAVKIEQKFFVNNFLKCDIVITGYEQTSEITLEEINPQYQIASSVETQAQCQNMLFLGNIQRPEIPYKDLEDISLRFLPFVNIDETYSLDMDQDYNINSLSQGYYDPKYIYNKVGYWNHEIYRFGIVYIMADNSLSPVFNIRGIENLTNNTEYSEINLYDNNNKRNYITIEENTYKIVVDKHSSNNLENAKGVVSLNQNINNETVLGIDIKTNSEVIDYLKELKIKGFFFVRQKRIPTTLCQAYTIGIDKESKTPVLPIEGDKFIAERFLDDDQILNQDFNSRKYIFDGNSRVRIEGAICPEYDVDSPYYNSLFTGDKFVIQESDIQPNEQFLHIINERNFYTEGTKTDINKNLYSVKIIGVEDNTKLVAINDNMFSARAGEAEEAFRYEYLEKETKLTKATNLIRGSFGPYLGITGYQHVGKMIDIKIPGYDTISTEDLFKIRYNDKSSFFAISERMALKDINDWITETEYTEDNPNNITFKNPLYRGDCYICKFTHRLNRNFQDPSSPINDKVVDDECWKDNYEVDEGTVKTEKFEKINLGDVNAIKMGMWVTLTVRSSKNLNIRSIDDSVIDESTMFGHGRGFYPLFPLSADGAYKIPEALCYNKGFEVALSERYNFELPDVPAIKNDFTNRIAYSDIHVNDAFKNGYRVFQGNHYRDYPKTYGSITKLVEFRGNLVCVFEHGVALISVNERAVASEGSGGLVYINTSNVLPENPLILSDTFGSQWKDSIIKTSQAIYGVDTVGKKIWRTNGSQFECISDFKIQEFLNNNITLNERDLTPIIGIRNVKTHYNKFKQDVMFTFYDNLENNEETVWNICYNETLQKWITFYSWVPSYSENINNQFFTFDRNTSKWIAKLGASKEGNYFSDSIVLSNNEIPNNGKAKDKIGEFNIINTNISNIDKAEKEFRIISANIKDWEKYFKIENNILYLATDAINLCSEFYVKGIKEGNIYKQIITDPKSQKEDWVNHCILNSNYVTCKDDSGKRITLDITPEDKRINGNNPVYLLNIEAIVKVDGIINGTFKSTLAVIPEYNKQFLTTDFWKHGQAGIIDIADKIYPTFWYGKQHPFEFEFIVADNPMIHKIYDNLEIISNKAEPESFHYEVIGECYDFAKDKKNMYIRQEATKDLYRLNGVDITYDHDYVNLKSEHRELYKRDGKTIYDKSTLFPLYYSRTKSVNDIEDYYHRKKGEVNTEDFSALAGAEIVKYDNLNEYRIWNHCEAVDLSKGRLRGNMQYKEDKWDVQINPINLVQKNEDQWLDINGNPTDKIPIELNQNPLPDVLLTKDEVNITSDDRGVTVWNDCKQSEAKLKDKFIKIRIRYSGKDLAIINAIKTFYSASYS